MPPLLKSVPRRKFCKVKMKGSGSAKEEWTNIERHYQRVKYENKEKLEEMSGFVGKARHPVCTEGGTRISNNFTRKQNSTAHCPYNDRRYDSQRGDIEEEPRQ
jgi:hypothetical protein